MSPNGKAYEEYERARKRGLKEAVLYRQRGQAFEDRLAGVQKDRVALVIRAINGEATAG